jgi:putative NADH-flavin reductase
MHFLLLGASGWTGQHVVSELLSQGHTAVALVHLWQPHPSSWPHHRHWLATIEIRLHSALLAAPLSPSAAIITLNIVRKSDNPFAAQITSSLPSRLAC